MDQAHRWSSRRCQDIKSKYKKHQFVDVTISLDVWNFYDDFKGKQAGEESGYVGKKYKFLRLIGADVVGMSTVPEVIVANHMQIPVFAISVITDEGFPEILKPVSLAKHLQNLQDSIDTVDAKGIGSI